MTLENWKLYGIIGIIVVMIIAIVTIPILMNTKKVKFVVCCIKDKSSDGMRPRSYAKNGRRASQ